MGNPLARVEDALRADGGLLAAALAPESDHPPTPTPHGDLAGGRHATAVEAIREGYLLHYGSSRLLAVADDPDLALLAGDRLYALGLAELAALGDLEAIRTMASVIAASAVAHAAHDSTRADGAWETGARTLADER